MLPLFALLSIAVVFQVQQKDSSVLYEKNNFYHRVRVLNQFFNHKGNVTVLMLDTTYEGGQFNQSSRPLFPYHNAWQFIRLLEKPEHVLFLGGGAYSMPKLMSSAYPETIIEVVEVDPDVVDVGRKYFEIDQFKMLKPKVDDARHYLSRTVQRYDMIVGDVYHGIRSIPAHFTTQEFFKTVDQKLKAEGFFLLNIYFGRFTDCPVF